MHGSHKAKSLQQHRRTATHRVKSKERCCICPLGRKATTLVASRAWNENACILVQEGLTRPRASLTSKVANSHDNAGKLMLKFNLSCSSCLLRSTTISDLVMGVRKALSSCMQPAFSLKYVSFVMMLQTLPLSFAFSQNVPKLRASLL